MIQKRIADTASIIQYNEQYESEYGQLHFIDRCSITYELQNMCGGVIYYKDSVIKEPKINLCKFQRFDDVTAMMKVATVVFNIIKEVKKYHE